MSTSRASADVREAVVEEVKGRAGASVSARRARPGAPRVGDDRYGRERAREQRRLVARVATRRLRPRRPTTTTVPRLFRP